MIAQQRHQSFAGLGRGQAAGIEAQIGDFGVQRCAGGGHRAQDGLAVGMLQQRPYPVMSEAAQLLLDRQREVQHAATFAHQDAVGLEQNGTTAGGDEAIAAGQFEGELAGLALAEAGFTFLLEDRGHPYAGSRLDGLVEIDERKAETLGETPTDGGLARPHGADQHEVHRRIHGRKVASAAHGFHCHAHHPPMSGSNACRRLLLIAGAGDTGQRLAALAAGGWDVLALRRSVLPTVEGVRAVQADLCSGEGFAALPRRLDALVFCAAPGERTEAAYRALYRDGLRRLLDRGRIGRVLFVSSTAVHAEDAGGVVDEATPADATAFNGRVLREAEDELAVHPDAAVLRASGIYGPGRERMWNRARRDEAGEPRWTNRIHVDDVAGALWHLLEAPHIDRVYCGNDDQPVLEHVLVDGLRARLGLPALGAASGPITGKRVLNARLRASGWRPRWPSWREGYAVPPASSA